MFNDQRSLHSYFTEQVAMLGNQPATSTVADLADLPVYNRGVALTGRLLQAVTFPRPAIITPVTYHQDINCWEIITVSSENPLTPVGGLPVVVPIETIQRFPRVWLSPTDLNTIVQTDPIWTPDRG